MVKLVVGIDGHIIPVVGVLPVRRRHPSWGALNSVQEGMKIPQFSTNKTLLLGNGARERYSYQRQLLRKFYVLCRTMWYSDDLE